MKRKKCRSGRRKGEAHGRNEVPAIKEPKAISDIDG